MAIPDHHLEKLLSKKEIDPDDIRSKFITVEDAPKICMNSKMNCPF